MEADDLVDAYSPKNVRRRLLCGPLAFALGTACLVLASAPGPVWVLSGALVVAMAVTGDRRARHLYSTRRVIKDPRVSYSGGAGTIALAAAAALGFERLFIVVVSLFMQALGTFVFFSVLRLWIGGVVFVTAKRYRPPPQSRDE